MIIVRVEDKIVARWEADEPILVTMRMAGQQVPLDVPLIVLPGQTLTLGPMPKTPEEASALLAAMKAAAPIMVP